MGRPRRRTSPASGGMAPVMRLKVVLFPAPLGPMRARISPRLRLKDTPLTARSPPKAFLLSGFLAGLAGFLYAHFLRFVNPTPFSLEASIKYLVMAVAGGWGPSPG